VYFSGHGLAREFNLPDLPNVLHNNALTDRSLPELTDRMLESAGLASESQREQFRRALWPRTEIGQHALWREYWPVPVLACLVGGWMVIGTGAAVLNENTAVKGKELRLEQARTIEARRQTQELERQTAVQAQAAVEARRQTQELEQQTAVQAQAAEQSNRPTWYCKGSGKQYTQTDCPERGFFSCDCEIVHERH
jgi:hypothetical protein